MIKLTPKRRGGYSARKRIPEDVRDDEEAREAGHAVRTEKANARATDIGPVIAELKAKDKTQSLRALASLGN